MCVRIKKQKNKTPLISWRIVLKLMETQNVVFYRLCLKEKLLTTELFSQEVLLNKRSEFISKCRHKNKNLIKKIN